MSADYFANAVFGVVLGETEEEKEFIDAFTEALEVLTEEGDDEGELTRYEVIDQAFDIVEEENEELVRKIRDHYGAPTEATFHYSGDEDDRPGRCDMDANQVILGIGMMGFPTKHPLSDKFVAASEWYTWVEVG